jgi:small-conductance mechanosensitive channel
MYFLAEYRHCRTFGTAIVGYILPLYPKAGGEIRKSSAIGVGFGDNSLIFALYFWIDYGPEVNPMHVASDLRFMIDKRFAEENIVLAFPQRDVHLDSAQPFRIEVVSPSWPAS